MAIAQLDDVELYYELLGAGPRLLVIRLLIMMKPIAHRCATGQRSQRHRQKKNANPIFHSSALSF